MRSWIRRSHSVGLDDIEEGRREEKVVKETQWNRQ